MNDNDIIKALKHCTDNGECKECPANLHVGNCGHCMYNLMRRAHDLIKRQGTEIERLQKQLDSKCDRCIARDRAEAIREFVERLNIYVIPQKKEGYNLDIVLKSTIDWLAKEMTEVHNAKENSV